MTSLDPGEKSVVEHQDDAEHGKSRRPQHAALVCYREMPTGRIAAEWTYWDSREQARRAEAELTPCGPLCIAVHSVVRLDSPTEPRRRAGHR
jgi:hypothetical protein